jgi:hypothetical protein
MLKVFNETARYVDQCFIGETEIMTDSGFKQIKNVEKGDLVISSDGNSHEVLELIKSYPAGKQFITVETENGQNTVTSDHLFLAVKNGLSFTNIESKIASGIIEPTWIEAKNLTENDLLLGIE